MRDAASEQYLAKMGFLRDDYLHGSNGSYGEHVNSYFGITFRVYRIDPSHPELAPEIFSYDIALVSR